MTQQLLIWDIDPVIFYFGNFSIRYYGVLFATGLALGFIIMRNVFQRENQNLDHINSGFNYLAIGTVVGARLGHCLFYEPQFYLTHPLRILKIWEGGLASHGGAIGVIIAMWLYTRKYKINFLWLCDRLAIVIPLGAAFIRLGNFFNSEIIGKPTTLPWAITFQRIDSVPRHPAQLYESLSYLILFLVLWYAYQKLNTQIPKSKFSGIMLMWIFSSRFVIEFFKEQQVSFEQNLWLNMGQLLSVPFFILGVLFYTGKVNQWFKQG